MSKLFARCAECGAVMVNVNFNGWHHERPNPKCSKYREEVTQ